MTARTHDLAAFTLLAVVVIVQPERTVTLATAVAAVLANQIGGITPDIDQPTAPLWRNLPIARVFGRFAGKMMGGHRHITHSIIGVLLFGFVSRWFLLFIHPLVPKMDVELVWWAYIIGIISHLIMDMFTKEGVPILLPIPIKFGIPPIKKLRITTGKPMESVWFIGLVAFNIVLFATSYQEVLHILHNRFV